jgi:hypothetical protein
MSALLATLKLTTARKQRALPEVVKRRNKLLKKIGEQRQLAQALAQGHNYTPMRLRTVLDAATGRRVVREMPVRIKPWWWVGERGETLLSICYGSRTLELSKGKTAVEVADVAALPAALDVIAAAIQNNELDTQIEAASVKLRAGFKRTST